jgi:hypothetical protein
MPTETTDRQPTNATARLSVILDKLTANSSAIPVADVLVSVFQIQDADPNRAFLLAYTAITKMLETSEKEVVTYLSSELTVYGTPFPPLRKCFNPKNSAAQWANYRGNLTASDVTAIKYTAQRLKSLVPECEARDSDLADILTAVEQMSQALDDEALSRHSREALRECLEEIKRAVSEYQIWGTAGLNQAFKVFTGTLVTDQVLQDDLKKDTEKGGGLWDKVQKVGGGLMLLLGILHGVYQFNLEYLPTLDRLFLPQSTNSDTTSNSPMTPDDLPDRVAQTTRQVRI